MQILPPGPPFVRRAAHANVRREFCLILRPVDCSFSLKCILINNDEDQSAK